jgi:hypothetical protein
MALDHLLNNPVDEEPTGNGSSAPAMSNASTCAGVGGGVVYKKMDNVVEGYLDHEYNTSFNPSDRVDLIDDVD